MKVLITLLIFVHLSITLNAQQTYAIQLEAFKNSVKFNINSKKYEKLSYFGIVYTENESNGITKVLLKDFKNYYTSKENVNSILKKVRKTFKGAFVKCFDGNEIFHEPKLRISEKEILVSFKINDSNAPPSDVEVTPKSYNTNSFEEYRIYLGCWEKKKAWEVQNSLPERFRGSSYKIFAESVNDKSCSKYYFTYNNLQKADKDFLELKELFDVIKVKRKKGIDGIIKDEYVKL